jgi:predicted MFS family arabinose efflux permease
MPPGIVRTPREYEVTNEAATPKSAALYWLALGAFAVGTEGFMIAGILPRLAADLSVSPGAAGYLVTAFAFAYAISSPILTTLTEQFNRRNVLIWAMCAFAIGNILAYHASGYWGLMAARIALALAAGVYMPGANALAGALVPPNQRGRAIAIVNGGVTAAVALGVPLGSFSADRFGWRMTFGGVSLLALLASLALSTGLHKKIADGLPTTSLKQRIAVARRGPVLLALLVTFLWASGIYSVYTYLAVYLQSVTRIPTRYVGTVLFAWGVAAGMGLTVGGAANDRFGARAVILPCLSLLILVFVSLSTIAHLVPREYTVIPVLTAVVVWGVASWAFFPAQQVRLIGLAGPAVAAIALSLNASFMYLGFSAGATEGSLALTYGGISNVGWGGAAFEIASLLLMIGTTRRVACVSVSEQT